MNFERGKEEKKREEEEEEAKEGEEEVGGGGEGGEEEDSQHQTFPLTSSDEAGTTREPCSLPGRLAEMGNNKTLKVFSWA